jgi:hypothetical protein
MRRFLAIAIAFQCARFASAGTLPLTGKDIVLMVKMGYSSQSIMRDLNAKHFLGPLDPSCEAQLRQLNASPALLDALKSGNNAASEEELAQARKRIADAQVASSNPTADQRAIDQKAAAMQDYLAQQKLDMRVRDVLREVLSYPPIETPIYRQHESKDVGHSPDYKCVIARAVLTANHELPNCRDWRLGKRIQELMQDEAFVRDTLKVTTSTVH